MKERNAKVVEIILRTVCIVSLLFVLICHSVVPILICFICYLIYRTVKEVIFYIKRLKQNETHKIADTILVVERVICHIILIAVLFYYFS